MLNDKCLMINSCICKTLRSLLTFFSTQIKQKRQTYTDKIIMVNKKICANLSHLWHLCAKKPVSSASPIISFHTVTIKIRKIFHAGIFLWGWKKCFVSRVRDLIIIGSGCIWGFCSVFFTAIWFISIWDLSSWLQAICSFFESSANGEK